MTLDNIPKTRDLMRGEAGEKLIVTIETPSAEPNNSAYIRDLTITLTDVLANQ